MEKTLEEDGNDIYIYIRSVEDLKKELHDMLKDGSTFYDSASKYLFSPPLGSIFFFLGNDKGGFQHYTHAGIMDTTSGKITEVLKGEKRIVAGSLQTLNIKNGRGLGNIITNNGFISDLANFSKN